MDFHVLLRNWQMQAGDFFFYSQMHLQDFHEFDRIG